MGMFSWLTGDTRRSITNSSAPEGALPVYLILPDGTYLYEDKYEGYGRFGGRDFFGLVWQLNSNEKPRESDQYPPGSSMHEEFAKEFDEANRGKGIDLAWRYEDQEPGGEAVVFPKFAEVLVPWDRLPNPERCPDQGFGGQEFGGDEEDEEE